MSVDFFYALITGWFILAIFWATIIIFISIRKPPKSKLSNRTILMSILIFLLLFMIIYFLK